MLDGGGGSGRDVDVGGHGDRGDMLLDGRDGRDMAVDDEEEGEEEEDNVASDDMVRGGGGGRGDDGDDDDDDDDDSHSDVSSRGRSRTRCGRKVRRRFYDSSIYTQ